MILPPLAGPRAFARYMLQEDRLPLAPVADGCRAWRGGMEVVLFRQGSWQVVLVTLPPNAQVPRHRHLRANTVDLLMAGGGLAEVDGRELGLPRGRFGAGLMRVPRGEWHEGHAGPAGVAYLSFQHWQGAPGFLTEDWEAWSPEQT